MTPVTTERHLTTQKDPPAAAPADPLRNAVRFPLRLQVRVETGEGVIDATTEDISSSGVQFSMESGPGVDAKLTWSMVLPGQITGAPADAVVHCVGRVVWEQPGLAGRRVGVVIDHYRIEEGVR